MFEQDRVLARLQQRVLGERDILVCFLSGSYGRRTNDPFSDLDVALVFADDDARDDAYGRRRQWVQSVLPYVPARSFDARHVRPYLHIALYSNGTKVDYRYETQTGLLPNPWDREIKILKDTAAWGEQFQAAAPQTLPPQPILSAEALADLDNRFWVMFWDVYRLLQRGDHSKPFPIYLQLLHFTLPDLLQMLPDDHPAYQALLQVRFEHDVSITAAHMRSLLDCYLDARTAVVKRHNIPFMPDGDFERNVQKLVGKRET